MVTSETIGVLLDKVADPEIPELTVMDLGIVRDWRVEGGCCHIVLTPTYSGCPAYETIEKDIRAVLAEAGVARVMIEKRYSPPWTTDWLSPRARERLKAVGIAPPCAAAAEAPVGVVRRRVACPRCDSQNTEEISFFSSTACKAQHRCLDCLEPFEEFKSI